jgi:hypothetical protein
VLLTTSQLPGNVAGPGIRIWRHSPFTGCTTVKGEAGAANMRKTPHAPTSAAIRFRISNLLSLVGVVPTTWTNEFALRAYRALKSPEKLAKL